MQRPQVRSFQSEYVQSNISHTGRLVIPQPGLCRNPYSKLMLQMGAAFCVRVPLICGLKGKPKEQLESFLGVPKKDTLAFPPKVGQGTGFHVSRQRFPVQSSRGMGGIENGKVVTQLKGQVLWCSLIMHGGCKNLLVLRGSSLRFP